MKFKINVYESVCEVISASDLSPCTLCCDCTHGCSAKAFRLSRSGPQGGLFTALPPGPSALTLPHPTPDSHRVLSQVAEMQEGRAYPDRETFAAQLGETDKEPNKMRCEKCTAQRARLPWEQSGGLQPQE